MRETCQTKDFSAGFIKKKKDVKYYSLRPRASRKKKTCCFLSPIVRKGLINNDGG